MEDDEMEDNVPGGDDDLEIEIDLDYEFDAPRFFDLGRPELPVEAREAELWLMNAGSYPPSPLVAKISAGNINHAENTNTVSNLEELKCTKPDGTHSAVGNVPHFSAPSESHKGSALHSCMPHDVIEGDEKSHVKGPFSKGSRLMKPTASQLAKQNQTVEVKNELWKSLIMKGERIIVDTKENVSREAKRQKLEGGHIFKVLGEMQHMDLIHKVTKKNGPTDCNSRHPRLKITVPREPELETAKRAKAFRAQRARSKNTEDIQDGSKPTTSTFKARPLNKKIFEAPSFPFPQKSIPRLPNFQEFHLKTHERAIKHSMAAASSSGYCDSIAEYNVPDSSIQGCATGFEKSLNLPSGSSQLQYDDKKWVECGNMLPKFKARPLNKKIISSKGDVGVFRSTKREITKPKEFKFSTNRKRQQSPLTELFNKLSLASEARQSTAADAKLQETVHTAPKGFMRMRKNLRSKYSIVNDKLLYDFSSGSKMFQGFGHQATHRDDNDGSIVDFCWTIDGDQSYVEPASIGLVLTRLEVC